MSSLIESIAGLVFVYLGLSAMRRQSILGFFGGLLSIVGLLMAVHGTLIFNVPNFFK